MYEEHTIPRGKNYTYFSECHKVNLWIDYILKSPTVLIQIQSPDIGFKFWTVHTWVNCLLNTDETTETTHHWTLNKNLLKNTN